MSGDGGLRYDRYTYQGNAEWLMRIGPADGMPILFVPPLFEELNRTRALLVTTMKRLAGKGHACWLPDLPGTSESERALEDCNWQDWASAVQAVAELARSPGRRLLIASWRGGALLDDVGDAVHWRFAPADGASLLRDLSRSGLVGGDAQAGYAFSDQLSADLRDAKLPDVAPCRTVRLASDPKPSDAKLDGPALWRRSEPANSDELAALITSDIADWADQCGSC